MRSKVFSRQLSANSIRSSVLAISKLAIGYCLLLTLFISCKNNKPNLTQEEKQGLPTDFTTFYDKFHRDSAYQMAHINFPLDGMPSGSKADSVDLATFRWTADTWQMHRAELFDANEFNRSFQMPFDGAVVEVIVQKTSPYGTMRRFLKRGDEWFLIYYADINRIETKQ